MSKVFNREKEPWIRPWNREKFDDLYNRDERFFAIVIKGFLSWLNRNIVLYNKSINHFVFNTGSSYLYIESNGYEYNVSEVTGEDTMYMTLPRCIVDITDISFPMEELTAPFSRGNYERQTGNMLAGYNAEMRRLPIEITLNMKYYLSNFNETIILLQEIVDKMIFQTYFNVTYLGKVIQCSIEFPANMNPEINKIDMASPEPNQRNLTFDVKIDTNYPVIDTRTEIPTDKVIEIFGHQTDLHLKGFKSDSDYKGKIINDHETDFNNFDNNYKDDKPFTEILNQYVDQSDIDDFISKFDINGDKVIDEVELIDMLDKMKYGFGDSDKTNTVGLILHKTDNMDEEIENDEGEYAAELKPEVTKYIEKCHYSINYKDIFYLIKIINKQETVSAHYDKFTKKIYVTHNDTGDTKEISISKYNVVN